MVTKTHFSFVYLFACLFFSLIVNVSFSIRFDVCLAYSFLNGQLLDSYEQFVLCLFWYKILYLVSGAGARSGPGIGQKAGSDYETLHITLDNTHM